MLFIRVNDFEFCLFQKKYGIRQGTGIKAGSEALVIAAPEKITM